MVHFLDLTRLFQPSTFEEDAEDWIFRLDRDDVEVECDFDHPKGGGILSGGGSALGYCRREVSSISPIWSQGRVGQIQSKALSRLRSCGAAGFLEQYIS